MCKQGWNGFRGDRMSVQFVCYIHCFVHYCRNILQFSHATIIHYFIARSIYTLIEEGDEYMSPSLTVVHILSFWISLAYLVYTILKLVQHNIIVLDLSQSLRKLDSNLNPDANPKFQIPNQASGITFVRYVISNLYKILQDCSLLIYQHEYDLCH